MRKLVRRFWRWLTCADAVDAQWDALWQRVIRETRRDTARDMDYLRSMRDRPRRLMPPTSREDTW
jgi:hypothetical protein